MKPSDTKGSECPPVTSGAMSAGRRFLDRTSNRTLNLIETYKGTITYLRGQWQRCPTPTGKPKFGPSYFAITWCEYEDEIGLTDTKAGVGKRWACNTCNNFVEPIWSDTDKCPSPDEALHEYVAWQSKLGVNSSFRAWKKGIHGHDVR
jgi:hypothetical protein